MNSNETTKRISCDHCQLPVPPGLIEPGAEHQFCCHGCKTAFQLISSCGLSDYYRMAENLSDGMPLQNRGSSDGDGQFQEFDDPSFTAKFVRIDPYGFAMASLSLDGIHCAACVWLLEKIPQLVEGIRSVQVNWAKRSIALSWDPQKVKLSQIARTIYQLGYTPHAMRETDRAKQRKSEQRQHLIRIGVSGAAAGNNMLIAAALYLGMFSEMTNDFRTMLRIASTAVGLFSVFGPGRVFLRSAWNALRTWTPHMDLPIALGLLTGSTVGLINTIRGTGDIYFDSLSVLVFLLLVARWIQFSQQSKASDAIELLYKLTPQRARKITTAGIQEVSIEDVKIDDELQVRPGDLIPVDGRIVLGESELDEAIVSGEAKPVSKFVDDGVTAGTRNLSGLLQVKAIAVGSDTRISRIIELVEHASAEKPRIVEWANRIGGYFVVTVMALAVGTFLFWLALDNDKAVDRAVALLVVACPCALALATPLAISVAMGRLAKRQILVKQGDVFQSLARPGVLWLDKTGTVTQGDMSIQFWNGDDSIIPAIVAVEKNIVHPIRDAWLDFANGKSFSGTVSGTTLEPGGVGAMVEGSRMLIGNRRFMEQNQVAIVEEFQSSEQQILNQGLAPCFAAWGGQLRGIAGIGDKLKPDAGQTIERLRRMGWQVGLLSGDHPNIVQQFGSALGIEREQILGGVTPEEKLSWISKQLKEHPERPAVMVGDGVNDSAALAAATVGIAVHSSAEASLAAAPVYLGSSQLNSIVDLFQSSLKTNRVIHWNFAISLAYNILGVALAVIGWINPLIAALLMPVSSLTVVAISMRAGEKYEIQKDSLS
ncbi:MAG: heavy metal translocating P-type ATPase [Pirellulaceae bacterium]